ncbi:MAG: hypothetical protein OXC00_00225 [Acidimicrobiaceae bacterium]|nr:hypothetical protein [Acidimicrobiaceae bacterium]
MSASENIADSGRIRLRDLLDAGDPYGEPPSAAQRPKEYCFGEQAHAVLEILGQDVYVIDLERYRYRIFWHEPDHEWVGICEEFGPQLSWMDPDRQAAEGGIRELVCESIQILAEHGEPIPSPAR